MERARRRRHGQPNIRLVRFADDWCLMVSGTRAHAEALREEIAEVLTGMGLRLSPEKTLITHIDEGLDFLGWHIQLHQKRGAVRKYVYTYPARKAIKAVEEVAARLAGTLAGWGCWDAAWSVPTSGGITQARQRLGYKPLRQLFGQVAVPVAELLTRGASWRAGG